MTYPHGVPALLTDEQRAAQIDLPPRAGRALPRPDPDALLARMPAPPKSTASLARRFDTAEAAPAEDDRALARMLGVAFGIGLILWGAVITLAFAMAAEKAALNVPAALERAAVVRGGW